MMYFELWFVSFTVGGSPSQEEVGVSGGVTRKIIRVKRGELNKILAPLKSPVKISSSHTGMHNIVCSHMSRECSANLIKMDQFSQGKQRGTMVLKF